MDSILAFQTVKGNWYGKNFIFLFELTYDPTTNGVLRFAKYDKSIIFEDVEWLAFPMAGIEVTSSVSGEIPAFDISITNAGRVMMSVMEYNVIEGMKGRLLWVHPDHLDDPTAKKIARFTVMSARAIAQTAVLTVAPIPVDLMNLMLPKGIVSVDRYPGVVGTRTRIMV